MFKELFHLQVFSRCFATNTKPVMKYLNVAEKNDAAKNISALLSRGNSIRVSALFVEKVMSNFKFDYFF